MKILSIILVIVALIFIGINISKLDPTNPFEGDSMVAIIGMVAGLCAVLLLLIYRISKKIQAKLKDASTNLD